MTALPTGLASSPTIPELARALSTAERPLHRKTLWRRLIALHAQDRCRGADGWLYRVEGGTWRVNLGRLKAAHPEMFDAPDVRDLDARVTALEERVGDVEYQQLETAKQVGSIARKVFPHKPLHRTAPG